MFMCQTGTETCDVCVRQGLRPVMFICQTGTETCDVYVSDRD